jgi:hypothetical protein
VSRGTGQFTLGCRAVCSALVVAPFAYRLLVTEGSAYEFLALLVLAPIAGLVLIANSVFCLLRQRTWAAVGVNLFFSLLGVMGILVARYYLPQFRM